MKHFLTAAALALVAPTAHAAGSEPIPIGIDGPWITIPVGTSIGVGPLSRDAIFALADLDGDPSVTTAQETAMINILLQVLGAAPIDSTEFGR